MSCGVGGRCELDLGLLWLWHTLEATAPIRPQAWELPYATGAAQKKTKKKKENETQPGEETAQGHTTNRAKTSLLTLTSALSPDTFLFRQGIYFPNLSS